MKLVLVYYLYQNNKHDFDWEIYRVLLKRYIIGNNLYYANVLMLLSHTVSGMNEALRECEQFCENLGQKNQ